MAESFWQMSEGIRKASEEARKQFDDAIYRLKHNDSRTAADVWAELTKAQNDEEEDGFVSGLRCAGLLNELKRRGQIADW